MKSSKPAAATKSRKVGKQPSQMAIIRAVASSTAIETGKSICEIERTLRDGKSGKFRDIKLAH